MQPGPDLVMLRLCLNYRCDINDVNLGNELTFTFNSGCVITGIYYTDTESLEYLIAMLEMHMVKAILIKSTRKYQ